MRDTESGKPIKMKPVSRKKAPGNEVDEKHMVRGKNPVGAQGMAVPSTGVMTEDYH